MKKLILIITLMYFYGCSTIQDTHPLEMSWQVMHAIDVAQTYHGVGSHPHCRSEGNLLTKSIIGEKPSKDAILMWGVGASIAHYFIGKWIDKKSGEDNWNIGVRLVDNAEKLTTINKNHNNGIRLNGLTGKEKAFCDSRLPENSINIPILKF